MYHVELLDLPYSIRSFVRHNQDGSDTIILNSRLNRETQIEAMMHEIEHIDNDDFYSDMTVDQIEMERHHENIGRNRYR